MNKTSDSPLLQERSLAPEVCFVVPAHNEEATIGNVVQACIDAGRILCADVVVVDDCSSDSTGAQARAAGATVLERTGEPSKALALTEAVNFTAARHLFFVDADCTGLERSHLLRMAALVLDGGYHMAVGVFDYPVLAGLVQRIPWSTGQRIIRRELFPLEDPRLAGYNVEALINETVGKARGATASLILEGVRQRTKRDKLGPVAGTRSTLRMWSAVASSTRDIDRDAYRKYMIDVRLTGTDHEFAQHPAIPRLGFAALSQTARLLRAGRVVRF